MSALLFTEDHEWLVSEEGLVTIGITDYAQEQMGDVVFVELPATGQQLNPDDNAVSIETVKTVSEIAVPVAGAVVEVNEKLNDDPSVVNQDPLGDGWFFKMRTEQELSTDQFMDHDQYQEYLKGC